MTRKVYPGSGHWVRIFSFPYPGSESTGKKALDRGFGSETLVFLATIYTQLLALFRIRSALVWLRSRRPKLMSNFFFFVTDQKVKKNLVE